MLDQLAGQALSQALSHFFSKLESDDAQAQKSQMDSQLDMRFKAIWDAIRKNGASDRDQAKIIQHIIQELNGLTPHNINPQLDDIREWMRLHVKSEEKTLRELAQRQHHWNVCLAIISGLAIVISIIASISK